ncbi:uncharacterized protein LOC120414962 isoform X2 [Culex pipiens pallens]|uniref:uncharacterized protein LOC120414962 isoform X2 n=1 Tax=Culex pipiens pallens TaxID=42434 RepID=UPI0022AB0369|nr:uncharacterized protein LOC120414962 isoform X2 [Culex pipiens pallens]
MVRTREESSFFLIGIGNPDSLTKLPKLPTVRETLARCMYLVQEQRKVDQACRSTTAELLDTWERVHIPLQLKQNVVVVIRKLYDDWVKIKKNKQKELDRKKKFLAKLDTLLDISSRKAETTDDRAMEFLEDQRGRRQFGLAVMDGSASKRKSVVIEPEAETSVEPTGDTSSTDPDYVPEPKRVKIDHHIKSSEAKPNVLTEDVLSALDRNKVSDRQAFKIIMPVVAALDVDGSTMALSRSTITRRRQEARKEIAVRAKAEFDPQGPLVVHWDGTKLENVGNSAHSERLPVLVSWSDGEKLLGAPAVSHPTGDQESHVVYDCLEEWDCLSKVCAMSFDTTSVNTGKFKGKFTSFLSANSL